MNICLRLSRLLCMCSPVNCNSMHDFPTPVSPIIMYLNRYSYDIVSYILSFECKCIFILAYNGNKILLY